MSRQSLKTPQMVEVLLHALEKQMPYTLACDIAGIDRKTPYNWAKADKAFSARMAYARAIGIREVIQATVKKEPWKVLKNLAPDEFRDEVQVAGEVKHTFSVKAADGEFKLLR